MTNWWTNYPWRMIQPNFREIDTKDFDEEKFFSELKSFSCNAVMINAAGLIANYQTELEDHMVNPYLDEFDMKRIVDRCHENGIKVIARTDFSKIPESVFERHPDWVYRHADGTPLNYNGYVQTCLSGGYQKSYMDEILKEMFARIPFDGIYCNMGSATGYIVDYSMKRHGPCQCDACKAAFREKYGMDIPTELRPGDKTSMVYFRFQQELAGAQKQRITKLLKTINPNLAYCSVDYSRQEAHTEFKEELPHWQYRASSCARAMRGMDVEATVANVDFMGFAYRHPSCSAPLQELRLWQTLSNFSGIDYYVIGRLYDKADKSTFDRVKRVFSYAAAHENTMYGVQSVSDILLVRDSYIIPNKEEWGWVRLLTENHFFFDETLMGGLGKKDLSRYKAVILPEKVRLAVPLAAKINEYVKNGGIVITSGKTPALECLGHIAPAKVNKEAFGAMLEIRESETDRFPSFKNRPYLINGSDYIELSYEEGTEMLGAYRAPERFGPPELCYATEGAATYPAAAKHAYGNGCAITLPWYPATNYYTDGHEAFLLFVKDLLSSVCGIAQASKTLSPMVEVTHGRKDDFEVVHFVNGTGHFGNSFFDPAVLLDVCISIPWSKDSAECENLDEPNNVTWEVKDGMLEIRIPKLAFHAGIVIR